MKLLNKKKTFKKEGLHHVRENGNDAAIIFVHGLQGHPFRTWTKKGFKSLPHLLMEDEQFNLYDIYSFGYNTGFILKRHHFKVISNLLNTEIEARIDHKEIYFVTHSMGGIIVQSMLAEQVERDNKVFKNKVKGIVYLAVPFAGSSMASIASKAYALLPPFIGERTISQQTRSLQVFSKDLAELSLKWVRYMKNQIAHIRELNIYGESDGTVATASSRAPYIQDSHSVDENHISICKIDKESTVYQLLVRFFNVQTYNINDVKINKTETGLYHEFISKKPKITPSLNYPLVKGHIPRKLIQVNKYNSLPWLIDNEDLKEPLDIIKESKHVVLLGGAGTGKSIEMKYIASICSQISSPFVPILIKLNKFVPRSFNEIISEYWPDWNLVPDNELLLILDGLDEIESHYKKDAIKYIELFLEQHPEMQIIISCRRNFYQSENDHFSGTLQGFKTFLLYDLNQRDIDSYIDSVLGEEKSEVFKIAIRESNLKPLINIPFYLTRIIDLYQKHDALPESKADLFHFLITQGLYNDINHFKNSVDLSKEQQNLINSLETVALSMEDLGRNYLTDEELKLVTKQENIELLRLCTLWKRSEENNEIRWQFEHNNFQEFLAARILSRQKIEVIKDYLSFPPEHKKVIPSWVNTLSFLVSILGTKDNKFAELLKWVNEGDPEMLIHFEADRLDESLRTQLFQNIFSNYEERQVWINRDKFDFESLANFGQSDDNIEYLINKVLTGHYTSRVNAIKLLEFMRIPISKKIVLRQKLTKILINSQELPVVISAALSLLSKYKSWSSEQVEQILSSIRASSNDTIRTYLYKFLVDCNLVEDNIDVFLEGIQYIGIDFNNSKSRLLNEKIDLERGLQTAKSSSSMNKILNFFNDKIDQIDHTFLKDQLLPIGTNAALAYGSDSSIFNSVLDLFKCLKKKYWLTEAKDLSIFFDKSQTRQRAVEILFKQRSIDEEILGTIGLLIDEESINYISQQYLMNELSNDDIWKIQREISSRDFYLAFNNRMNEISNNEFLLQPRRDYEQERKDDLKRDIDMLFNKNTFLEQVKNLYETVGSESFTQDEIIKARIRRNEREYSTLVIDEIYRMAETEAISYKKVIEVIESWDWEMYALSKLYEILSSSSDVTLTDDQEEWIAEWCMKNVKSFDFKTACHRGQNGGITTSITGIILWYFQRRLNIKYPKAVFLNMISFDWIEGSKFLGIKYLEQYIDIETMSERIWDNLEKGIDLDEILENHLDFCNRHSINDASPFALQTICDTTRDSITRAIALKTYMKLSNDLDTLIQNLPNFTDNFKWDILKELFEKDKGLECQPYLITILEGEQPEEKLKSARFLIKLQNLEALKYYVCWVKMQVKNRKLIEQTMPLNSLKVIEALPYLFELLYLSYNDGFKQNEFERVDTEIRNAITNIALQSTQNFKVVQTTLESFIQDNSHLKYINFLNIFIEDVESKYYVTLQSGRDILEVTQRLDSIE